MLVRTWGDVLADVSDAEFREGIRRVEAKLSFFPVPADVMRQVEEARRKSPVVEVEALPERTLTFDRQIELNLFEARKILDMNRNRLDGPSRPDFRRAVQEVAQ